MTLKALLRWRAQGGSQPGVTAPCRQAWQLTFVHFLFQWSGKIKGQEGGRIPDSAKSMNNKTQNDLERLKDQGHPGVVTEI